MLRRKCLRLAASLWLAASFATSARGSLPASQSVIVAVAMVIIIIITIIISMIHYHYE